MMIEEAIRTVLGENETINDLVGGRIYPETRAQSAALPCLVFGISNEQAIGSFSGTSFWKTDIEIIAVAATKATAALIAEAVVAGIDGFVGTKSSTKIEQCLHSRSTTTYNSPVAGESVGAFIHTAIFSVHYKAG